VSTEIFVDPYEDYVKELEEKAAKAKAEEEKKRQDAARGAHERGAWFSNPTSRPRPGAAGSDDDSSAVGKHLAKALSGASAAPVAGKAREHPGAGDDDAAGAEDYERAMKKRMRAGKSDLSDFSAW